MAGCGVYVPAGGVVHMVLLALNSGTGDKTASTF